MTNSNHRIGMASVSFRNLTPREILEVSRAAGLDVIEWGSDVHAPATDIPTLENIAALQSEYGITCSSYGSYFKIGATPMAELADYISAAKILGTNIIRVWCGGKDVVGIVGEEREAFLEECKTAAKIAEENGAVLCMECHKNTFTEHLNDALELMERVNSKSFLMYWQPFQNRSIEENLAYAEAISKYTVHIHAFNMKEKARYSLNDGIEEWRSYLEKFTPPHTLLLEFLPNNDINELKIEADALREIVK
ncbi:MAG: sugar phosphate isomerase/epimerase [Clostridia bacterium]|nr:sugar phosphate isomerase/epimerase [Clostridia bacterium]